MKKGFTLIELKVVMAIMALVLISSTLVILQKQKLGKSVEKVAIELRNVLLEAHADAMSSSDATVDLTSVRIFYDSGSKIVTKRYMQSGASPSAVTVYTFPSNFTITLAPTTNNTFDFIANDAISLGQITGAVAGNQVFSISKAGTTDAFQVIVDDLTGNVSIIKTS